MRKQDEHDDELVTRAAALTISQLRPALKAALLEIIRELRVEAIEWLIESWWVRILVGAVTILGLLGIYVRART